MNGATGLGADLPGGLHWRIKAEFDINSIQITKLEDLSKEDWSESPFAIELLELLDKRSILEGRIINKILCDFKYDHNSIGASPRTYLNSNSAKNFWMALFDYRRYRLPFLVISDSYQDLRDLVE